MALVSLWQPLRPHPEAHSGSSSGSGNGAASAQRLPEDQQTSAATRAIHRQPSWAPPSTHPALPCPVNPCELCNMAELGTTAMRACMLTCGMRRGVTASVTGSTLSTLRVTPELGQGQGTWLCFVFEVFECLPVRHYASTSACGKHAAHCPTCRHDDTQLAARRSALTAQLSMHSSPAWNEHTRRCLTQAGTHPPYHRAQCMVQADARPQKAGTAWCVHGCQILPLKIVRACFLPRRTAMQQPLAKQSACNHDGRWHAEGGRGAAQVGPRSIDAHSCMHACSSHHA